MGTELLPVKTGLQQKQARGEPVAEAVEGDRGGVATGGCELNTPPKVVIWSTKTLTDPVRDEEKHTRVRARLPREGPRRWWPETRQLADRNDLAQMMAAVHCRMQEASAARLVGKDGNVDSWWQYGVAE